MNARERNGLFVPRKLNYISPEQPLKKTPAANQMHRRLPLHRHWDSMRWSFPHCQAIATETAFSARMHPRGPKATARCFYLHSLSGLTGSWEGRRCLCRLSLALWAQRLVLSQSNIKHRCDGGQLSQAKSWQFVSVTWGLLQFGDHLVVNLGSLCDLSSVLMVLTFYQPWK